MNLLEFSSQQNVSLSVVFVAMYLAAIVVCKSREMYICTLTCIATQAYGLSPLYNLTIDSNPSLVFLAYASIYFTAIRLLGTYRVIAMCFIMALFEGVMYKAYLNELGNHGIENWLYDNYESIVALLHAGIIIQMVEWARLLNGCKRYADNLLRLIRCYSYALPV
jgi:hypothetical protein